MHRFKGFLICAVALTGFILAGGAFAADNAPAASPMDISESPAATTPTEKFGPQPGAAAQSAPSLLEPAKTEPATIEKAASAPAAPKPVKMEKPVAPAKPKATPVKAPIKKIMKKAPAPKMVSAPAPVHVIPPARGAPGYTVNADGTITVRQAPQQQEQRMMTGYAEEPAPQQQAYRRGAPVINGQQAMTAPPAYEENGLRRANSMNETQMAEASPRVESQEPLDKVRRWFQRNFGEIDTPDNMDGALHPVKSEDLND